METFGTVLVFVSLFLGLYFWVTLFFGRYVLRMFPSSDGKSIVSKWLVLLVSGFLSFSTFLLGSNLMPDPPPEDQAQLRAAIRELKLQDERDRIAKAQSDAEEAREKKAEGIEESIKDVFNNFDIEKLLIFEDRVELVVVDVNGSEFYLLTHLLYDFEEFFNEEELQHFSQVDITVKGPLRDIYENVTMDPILRTKFTREVHSKVNWDLFVQDDLKRVLVHHNWYWLHPALR